MVYDVQVFGVGQGTEGFLPLNPQSVALPPELSHKRLDYGQIWQEPAISELDWLFTPIRKLEEHLHVAPLQASTPFNRRFTLLKNRSLGFGSHPSDLRHFHTSPLVNCGRLVSLRILLLDYPCHSDALPGTLFKTYGTRSEASANL